VHFQRRKAKLFLVWKQNRTIIAGSTMRQDQSALELNDRIPGADWPTLFNGQPALRTARQANQVRQSLESNLSKANRLKQTK
jgi:hypothetical protein